MRSRLVPLVFSRDRHGQTSRQPYSLRFSGRVPQVRNMSRKITGELWASSGDALALVAELEREQETVKWELDA